MPPELEHDPLPSREEQVGAGGGGEQVGRGGG